MALRNDFKQVFAIFILSGLLLLSSDACFSESEKTDPSENGWRELLLREPYPHRIPLSEKQTVLDGTYVKKATKEGNIVPCRRCPDWLPNPGIWKLNLKAGTYRIYHAATGWRSIGTYIVTDHRIILANDPSCIYGIGVYEWKFEDRKLTFKVIDDDCAIALRAKNLTEMPWGSCRPPGVEAAITAHWPKPQGCD